ncbi:MAG: hypothetical protein WD942_10035 [Dehalococcoidia bacterium]
MGSFWTSVLAVNKMVLKHVFEFVPFGPIEGKYLFISFISRRLLEPGTDESGRVG